MELSDSTEIVETPESPTENFEDIPQDPVETLIDDPSSEEVYEDNPVSNGEDEQMEISNVEPNETIHKDFEDEPDQIQETLAVEIETISKDLDDEPDQIQESLPIKIKTIRKDLDDESNDIKNTLVEENETLKPDAPHVIQISGKVEVEVDAEVARTDSENEVDELDGKNDSESEKKAEEEDEDLEEGEIEDDEEVSSVVTIDKKNSISSEDSNYSTSKSTSKHHHHSSSSKDKDKSSKRAKDKESKSEKRRKQSIEIKEEPDKSPPHRSEKSNRKRQRRSEDISGGDEDYLFVRGGSPIPETSILVTGNGTPGKKFYETDPFGHPIYEEDLEPTFVPSPEGKRRRKASRSPAGTERRRREESRTIRRPTSGRKEPIKPLHKSGEICAYYMQGKCQKSHEDCSYSHNAVPPRKMELCKFWMMDCCAKKEKCLYLHNDFPCKYYHTGLVCKQGQKNQCKFSHKPMNEVTKAVLLKHIETAPKEILGDFPRLNRQGALNLIAKMESKINGEMAKQEKERDEDRRRTRWEQPTRDDEEKLQELMEEAGIGNYYQETVEGAPTQEQQQRDNRHHVGNKQAHRHQHQQDSPHSGSSHMGMPPLMGLLPNQLPPLLPPQPHIVHNPALASVLATLHIQSSSIQNPKTQDGKENYKKVGKDSTKHYHREDNEHYDHMESGASPDSPPLLSMQSEPKKEDKDERSNDLPEHLPPMQRGIFKRIQEQQLKNEKKLLESPSDEDKHDDGGWYSSDEETDQPITDILKGIPEKLEPEKKLVVDFASVLSAIRKTTSAASNDTSEPAVKRSKISVGSPPLSSFTGRGDVDFRLAGPSQRTNESVPAPQGPFGDTDFRVSPVVRQEFKDIDLRMSEPIIEKKSPVVPVFKSLPTGPATMIDAAINSHPPMIWNVKIVDGVKPPDYNYIKHTLTQAQLALDPRFGPRTAGGISILPDPASPPQSSHSSGSSAPTNIPGGDSMMDPRVNRRIAQPQLTSQLMSDPRLGGDPRSGAPGGQGQIPSNLLPPGWPSSVDMTQAALAAQFIAAQQLGLLPFPNAGGIPFPPNFGGDMNTNIPPNGRPHFIPSGRSSGPPSSSWERYSQQHSGGLTPPL